MRAEVERAFRVADMMISCHSVLRDRFARRALALDLLILACSAWVTAMVFVDPTLSKRIIPFGLSAPLTIGFVGLFAFILSLFQLRVDWKQRAERHDRAALAYASLKSDLAGALRDNGRPEGAALVLRDYKMIGESCIAIPENQFNKLKRRHLLKVAISKELSEHPGASIWLIRLRYWIAGCTKFLRSHLVDDES